jgi:hypothetical protein
MPRRCLRFVIGVAGLWAVAASAAPPAPPPPETYDVQIRYSIVAFRNERLKQYGELMAYLKEIGFQRDPGEEVSEDEAENPAYTLLKGTIPSAKAPLLLAQRHIKSVLLVPRGVALPEDKEQPVRVSLKLASGFDAAGQRRFSEQTQGVLAGLGFRPAVGFDHQGNTRLVGSLPAGRLGVLLDDLRKTPEGAKQPAPFVNAWPVVWSEVRPDLPVPLPRPAPPAVPKGQESITPDLREVLKDQAKAAQPTRLEVILAAKPGAYEQEWQESLHRAACTCRTPSLRFQDHEQAWQEPLQRAAPGLVIEGRLGPLVSVVARPNQAPALAALPEVAAVRLPRVARPPIEPGAGEKNEPPRALVASGVTELHRLGHRGKGTTLAVVADDFRGWQRRVADRQLPASTRLVDLTRERNRDLEPDPFPGDPQQPGPGTLQAVAAMRAAPEAELVLVRVDPAAPYMLGEAARAINGEVPQTLSLDHRLAELDADDVALQKRQGDLLKERKQVMEEFGQDEESVKRRAEYRQRQAEYDRDHKALQQRRDRYFGLLQDLRDLKKVRVVTAGLAWVSGYPADGSSALSRYFDDRPFRGALWFQAAGDTRGQAWSGPFRDEDGNGVMEFAPPSAELPEGAWTRELNFLGWRPVEGAPAAELPAGARLRLSLQWREAHDPEFSEPGDDAYREPLADFRLLLLQQLDPAGKKQPSDDLAVVAQSAGRPQRLEQTASSATYEQTVEFTVPRAGRYALRVEGRPPEGTRPRDVPTLPALRQVGELRPRLFVETLEGAGKAVFDDFPTGAGTIGMPGDARRVLTVGAADFTGRPRGYSAAGPAHDLELLVKPDLWAYDDAGGTALAAAFAAGAAAATRSINPSVERWLETLPVRRGGVLKWPEGWFRR